MGKIKRNYWNLLWIVAGMVSFFFAYKVGNMSDNIFDMYAGGILQCFIYFFILAGAAFVILGITKITDIQENPDYRDEAFQEEKTEEELRKEYSKEIEDAEAFMKEYDENEQKK